MLRSRTARSVLPFFLVLGLARPAAAQNFPFTSGPIPLCDTSTFTASVWGIGILSPPGSWDPWNPTWWIQSLTINITSDHPQTLQIIVTSPQGTDLLLSEYNGAGGQNYTNTVFNYDGYPSITTGTAPFTGYFNAQGGSFSAFDYEDPNGTWTITVIDTACTNTGGGGGGGGNAWTPGWFDGSGGNGGFAFGFDPGPPPCWGGIPYGSATLCPGETVDILSYYSGSGYDISITLDGWTPVPDPMNVSAPGSYWVNATDMWGGCFYTATFDVVAATSASLGADQVVDQCDGAGPVDLTALFTYANPWPQWSLNGAPINTSDAAAATTAGVYQVIDPSGSCGDTALVTLNILNAPEPGPDQALSTCPGSSLDLTALYNTAGMTASWSFAGSVYTTPTQATDAGAYTLDVTDGSGCTAQAEVTLTVEAFTSLGADQIHDLCTNTTLDLTSLYTTTGLIATWSLWGAPVADPAHAAAGATYELVTSNGAGCGDTAYVAVNALTSPLLGADATAAACEGEVVDLTVIFNTTGLGSAWTLAGAPVPDASSVDASGAYALIATNTDGCSDTAQVVVMIAANPVLGADQSLTECEGTEVDLTTLYATGADGTAWTLNGTPVAEPASVTSSGTYTLTVTNVAGCTATAVVSLALEVSPSLGADQSSSICASSTFDLAPVYSTAGLSAAWTRNGATVVDPSAVDVTGDYQLVVTNGTGCTDTAVVTLLVNPDPSLGGDLFFSLCPWQTVDLGAVFPVAGMSASYTLDGQPLADPTAVADSGTYVVSVTDANGCIDEASASVVNVECMCVADFTTDVRCMQEPAQFTLLADSVVLGAQWEFSGMATGSTEIDPLMRFTTEGDVLVTLRATLSCGVVEVERTIHLDDCSDSCSVWIPSAFTPDGNGRNETWSWQGACEPEDFSILVYDRWGELVYSSNDPQSAWDGTYNGALCAPGVYAYRAGYRLPYQKRKEVRGAITLVR